MNTYQPHLMLHLHPPTDKNLKIQNGLEIKEDYISYSEKAGFGIFYSQNILLEYVIFLKRILIF